MGSMESWVIPMSRFSGLLSRSPSAIRAFCLAFIPQSQSSTVQLSLIPVDKSSSSTSGKPKSA